MAKAKNKDLVIVESPAKARTVARFLGDKYVVKASMGHVRDLPRKTMGVDIEKDFEPTYEQVRGRESVIREIKKAAKDAESVYLATDPDREGEAISWHMVEAVGLPQDSSALKRVVFHEITRPAIEEAFNDPRQIDMQLVNAPAGQENPGPYRRIQTQPSLVEQGPKRSLGRACAVGGSAADSRPRA